MISLCVANFSGKTHEIETRIDPPKLDPTLVIDQYHSDIQDGSSSEFRKCMWFGVCVCMYVCVCVKKGEIYTTVKGSFTCTISVPISIEVYYHCANGRRTV